MINASSGLLVYRRCLPKTRPSKDEQQVAQSWSLLAQARQCRIGEGAFWFRPVVGPCVCVRAFVFGIGFGVGRVGMGGRGCVCRAVLAVPALAGLEIGKIRGSKTGLPAADGTHIYDRNTPL